MSDSNSDFNLSATSSSFKAESAVTAAETSVSSLVLQELKNLTSKMEDMDQRLAATEKRLQPASAPSKAEPPQATTYVKRKIKQRVSTPQQDIDSESTDSWCYLQPSSFAKTQRYSNRFKHD